MRILEILLSIITILGVLQIIPLLKSINIVKALLLLAGGILIGHFILEGIRWQMAFIYLVIGIWLLNQFLSYQINNIAIKWTIFTLAILGVLISSGLSYFLPVFSLPKIQGEFNITSIHKIVETSNLEYKIWYPITENSNREKMSYHHNPQAGLQGVMGMPGFVFSHLRLVKTNAFINKETMNKSDKYPLIIYSHGGNSILIDNTALLEEIASNGYFIVAIDHKFSFEKYGLDIEEAKRMQVSTQKRLIDKLITKVVPTQVTHYEELIEDLKNRKEGFISKINFDKIALIGHSLGGSTACSGAVKIQNIDAVINMDGPIDTKIGKKYSVPLLYMSSFSPELNDSELEKMRVPPQFYREVKNYELKAVKEIFNKKSNNKIWVRFKDANHLDFTDIPFMIPFMSSPKYDKEKGHRLKSEIIIKFLNNQLKAYDVKLEVEDNSIEWIKKD